MSQLLDVLSGAAYDGSWSDAVGPQNDGTYGVPDAAQPINQPWDTGAGTLGNYGSDVLGILKYGVGLAAQNYNNRQILDYKRFEATAGGAFQQGQPANVRVPGALGFSMSPLLLIMLVGGAVLLLKK